MQFLNQRNGENVNRCKLNWCRCMQPAASVLIGMDFFAFWGSGILGVSFSRTGNAWLAYIKNRSTKSQINRYFRVSVYGWKGAKRKAIEARLELEEEMKKLHQGHWDVSPCSELLLRCGAAVAAAPMALLLLHAPLLLQHMLVLLSVFERILSHCALFSASCCLLRRGGERLGGGSSRPSDW